MGQSPMTLRVRTPVLVPIHQLHPPHKPTKVGTFIWLIRAGLAQAKSRRTLDVVEGAFWGAPSVRTFAIGHYRPIESSSVLAFRPTGRPMLLHSLKSVRGLDSEKRQNSRLRRGRTLEQNAKKRSMKALMGSDNHPL